MRRKPIGSIVLSVACLLFVACSADDSVSEGLGETAQAYQYNCYTEPKTLDVKILPNGKWLELRWSEKCQTNWARSGSPSPRNHKVRIETTWDPAGDEMTGWGTGFYTDAFYCPWGTPCKARACEWAEGSYSYCTAWL